MESEELKALSFVRRALLRKNEKIRELTQKVGELEQENEHLKTFQWRCADLEKEVDSLVNKDGSNGNQHFDDEPITDTFNDVAGDDNYSSLKSEVMDDDMLQEGSYKENDNEYIGGDAVRIDDASNYSGNQNFLGADTGQQLEHTGVFATASTSQDVDHAVQNEDHAEVTDSTRLQFPAMLPAVSNTLQWSVRGRGRRARSGRSGRSGSGSGSTKSHPCPHCTFSTDHKHRLKTHVQSRHTGEKPYQCHVCLKPFVRKDMLKSHILLKHSNLVMPPL